MSQHDKIAARTAPGPQTTRRTLLAGAAAMVCWPGVSLAQEASLAAFVASPHRSAANRARDAWRKPIETVAFLGIEPQHRVVEILPGSGAYWLEFLAPYLRERGLYVAAGRDVETATPAYVEDHKRLLAKLAADPARYDRVLVSKFFADRHEIAPAGSADFVLTFRNLHNWIDRNEIDGALRAFHAALKPGGILGVGDHRGRADMSQDAQKQTGYVRQDFAVAMIEKAGFKLAGASEAKANPRDTKDHPHGVWSLPPTFRGGDTDRAKFQDIGESDRFLLKFTRA
ncbi:MAG: methyltransferase [Beijerinckiaceae bacterium]|nr:methyltransferase [Beijerinckiaceae bacterium]